MGSALKLKCSAAVQAQLLTRLLPQLLRMAAGKSLSSLANMADANVSNPPNTFASGVISAFRRLLRSGDDSAARVTLRSGNKPNLEHAPTTPASPITPVAKPAPARASVPSIGNQAKTSVQPARTARKKQCNNVNRAKHCDHGRRATRCPECIQQTQSGTRSLCAHLKQKGWCLECRQGGARYYGDRRVWGITSG